MNIFIKKIKDLKSSEKKLIINFLVDCFSDNSGYKKSVYTNPDLDTCVLLYQNQELIGHVGITRRLVEHKINKYLVAGIGDVAIKSGLRHTGLGTKLMIEVNNLLKSKDYDVGVLFCHPKLHDFYTQSGWQKKNVAKSLP
ncbi:MAG: GNAT family N-acetyltransferase [Candidatus Shapirobacteria bacterium]